MTRVLYPTGTGTGVSANHEGEMNGRARIVLVALLAAALTALGAAPASAKRSKLRPILTVGNNWAGTADLVDPKRLERLARIDIVPDLQQRLAEIRSDPARLAYFLA